MYFNIVKLGINILVTILLVPLSLNRYSKPNIPFLINWLVYLHMQFKNTFNGSQRDGRLRKFIYFSLHSTFRHLWWSLDSHELNMDQINKEK